MTDKRITLSEWLENNKELADKATKGPWHKPTKVLSVRYGPSVLDMVCIVPEGPQHDADSNFIAASRLSLPRPFGSSRP